MPEPKHVSGGDWIAGDGLWSDPANWFVGDVPGVGDGAFIGLDDPDIENSTVQIDQPVFAEDLWVDDGMWVTNRLQSSGDTFPIELSALLTIAHENELMGGSTRHSSLFVYPTPAAYDLNAYSANVQAGGVFELREGAVASIAGSLFSNGSISNTPGTIAGQGVINLSGSNETFRNDGILDARGILTINQTGDGLFTFDGNGDSGIGNGYSGQVLVGGSSLPDGDGIHTNDHLTLNGTGLTKPLEGFVYLSNGRRLTMNLSEGWTAGLESEIEFDWTSNSVAPAVVEGAPVTLEGFVEVRSGFDSFNAAADFEADATINPTATVQLGEGALLRFKGDTLVNGGVISLVENAELRFDGPTTVKGGEFSTHSNLSSDGYVRFNGATTWNGTVVVNGVAQQFGDASVTGFTSIQAGVFDMDGGGNTTWNVNQPLAVVAESIDATIINTFDGTLNIGGTLGNVNIQLNGSFDEWVMNGVVNISNSLPFYAERVDGSRMRIAGELNADGLVRFAADTVFGSGSTTKFADSATVLGLQQLSVVEAGATFADEGTLLNQDSGVLSLADGVTLDQVGLVNEGQLAIGNSPGVASVDTFENGATGNWLVEVGGYLPGAEYDLLQVTGGETSLDGILSVDLIDGGSGLFLPEVGDEFIVLTSVGDVSGMFLEDPISIADGKEFHWEVLYHPHDVTLRVASIDTIVPEPTTFLLAALAMVCTSVGRRRNCTTIAVDAPIVSVDQGGIGHTSSICKKCLYFGLFLVAPMACEATEINYRPIALSGLPAPQTAIGVHYDEFNSPIIDDSGIVAFQSKLAGPGVVGGLNSRALFTHDGMSESLVVRSCDPIPGVVGDVNYNDSIGFFDIRFVGKGELTYRGRFQGAGVSEANKEALFSTASGSPEILALLSGPAPDAGFGVSYSNFGQTAANVQGVTVASVQLTGLGVDISNFRALYALDAVSGEYRLVGREGQSVSGGPPGSTFGGTMTLPRINASGQISFLSEFSGGRGLFLDTSGDLQPIVLTNTTVPEAPAGTNFLDFGYSSLNNAGDVAFHATLDGPAGLSEGVYSTVGGLHPVVMQGQQAPDALLAPNFQDFEKILLNDAGDMALLTTVEGTAVTESNNHIIYKTTPAGLNLVARQGQPIPDATDDARFGEPLSLQFNDNGQVALYSFLQGTNVDTTNNTALFAEFGGELRLIARQGDLFDVDPDPLAEDLREIEYILMSGSAGPHDGQRLSFNATGELAFGLGFVGGSSGIFVAETTPSADFNIDGETDGYDFLAWQRGESPSPWSQADLSTWQTLYSPTSVASSFAVPEPHTVAFAAVALLWFALQQNR